MTLISLSGGNIDAEFHRGEIGAPRSTLVFLHEGLGSIGLWRTFPADVRAECAGQPTLVYSRLGYGRSGLPELPRPLSYLHHEAQVVLPEMLLAFELEKPVLIGHSDGASIALLYAAAGFDVAGLVLSRGNVIFRFGIHNSREGRGRDLPADEQFCCADAGEHKHNDVEGALVDSWEQPASAKQTHGNSRCNGGIEPQGGTGEKGAAGGKPPDCRVHGNLEKVHAKVKPGTRSNHFLLRKPNPREIRIHDWTRSVRHERCEAPSRTNNSRDLRSCRLWGSGANDTYTLNNYQHRNGAPDDHI
jgi:Alpha/beta hydrolase family